MKKYIQYYLLSAVLVTIPLYSYADTELLSLQQAIKNNMLSKSSKLPASMQATHIHMRKLKEHRILVDILVREKVDELAAALSNMGMTSISVSDHMISGSFLSAQIQELAKLSNVVQVRKHLNYTRSGSVRSGGIRSMRAGSITRDLGYSGKGIRIGVLSDSYNCLGGEQADIESGDLPDSVEVIQELPDCTGGTDEGRALIQVMYDIARDANYFFYSGFTGGSAGNAEAIQRLDEEYQVDIIVDDFGSFSSSFFQDDLVAQAIDDVTKRGVTYISAAGNSGTNSYEHRFEPVLDPVLSLTAHDFDSTAGVDFHQSLTIPEGDTLSLVLQWDEPYFSISGGPGSQSDLDVYLMDELGEDVVASSATDNLGGDPIEVLQFYNPEGSGLTQFQLSIIHAAGRLPALIKYVLPVKFEGTINEYHTFSSTLIGHSNARGAIAVGATLYNRSTAYGYPINEVEQFSAAGGTPILFDINGKRAINDVPVRLKPNVTGPDGVNTTFYPGEDIEGDEYPNFRGTSASAPHVAAIAALILESNAKLKPGHVRQILESSAQDITGTDDASLPVGFDYRGGHGLVDGWKALKAAETTNPLVPPEPAGLSETRFSIVTAAESAQVRQDRIDWGQGSMSKWMMLGFVMLGLRVFSRRLEPLLKSTG